MKYTLLFGAIVISTLSDNAFGMVVKPKPKKQRKTVEINTFQTLSAQAIQQANQRRADQAEQQKLVAAYLGANEDLLTSLRARL